MANAYNNKVVLSNGTTIIDLSTDTVTDASHIMSGKVGHLADGSVVTGTGASESQVVSIEDVPNTTGTTAVITGVAAPEGSISITSNGTHDVTAYEEAVVNVPSQTPTIQPLSVTSNGTYTAPSGVDGYSPVTVNVSGGGGSVDPDADVIFIDYDGTVLYSYSASEFANLTAMPANPSHTGLTAQGWNWSLADAKAQLTAYPEAGLTIGQMYITDDGKTRLYVHMEEGRLHPYLGIGLNGTIVVDWGDGSSTDTLTGTSLTSVTVQDHEYAFSGDYLITLEVTSGSFQIYGHGNTTYILRKANSTTTNVHRVYGNCVRRVELGLNVSIGDYAFLYCTSLTSITIPSHVTSIGTYAFRVCSCLRSITIPSGVTGIQNYTFNNNCTDLISVAIPSSVTSLGTSAFASCYSLSRITLPSGVTSMGPYALDSIRNLTSLTIPSGVTSIGNYTLNGCTALTKVTIPNGVESLGVGALYGCWSLAKITIPASVTSIAASAFAACYGVSEYHFRPTTPPTLAATSAFTNIQSECKIYVPQGSLEAYQTATNWSTYASHMVEEE